MDIRAARDSFPGTRGRAFLDAACVSLMPTQAAQALAKLSDGSARPAPLGTRRATTSPSTRPPTWPEARSPGSSTPAPAEIALVESTTHALRVVADMVPLSRGDRVLVGETEFLGLAVPWIGRREAGGFAIDTVPHHEGRLRVEDFARAGDSRTRILLLISVQWSNGFRADLAAFAELARERGWILVVDAIQQLGAIPIDVRATPVDFLVCGGHKWLNAPAGRGFLYVNPAHRRSRRTAHAATSNRRAGGGLGRVFRHADDPGGARLRVRRGRPRLRARRHGELSGQRRPRRLGRVAQRRRAGRRSPRTSAPRGAPHRAPGAGRGRRRQPREARALGDHQLHAGRRRGARPGDCWRGCGTRRSSCRTATPPASAGCGRRCMCTIMRTTWGGWWRRSPALT